MAGEVTQNAKVVLDVNLFMGKVLNKDQFYKAFASTVKQMRVPEAILDPQLLIKPTPESLAKFDKQLINFNTDIAKRMANATEKVAKGTKPTFLDKQGRKENEAQYRSRLKTLQKYAAATSRAQSGVTDSTFKEFQGENFQKILDASAKGQNIRKIFGSEGAAQLKSYISLMDQLISRLTVYQGALARSSGITRKGFTKGEGKEAVKIPATGEEKSVIATPLQSYLKELKAERKLIQRGTEEGLAKEQADRDKESQVALRKQEAILARLSKRNDVERARREVLSQKRLAQRTELSQAKVGREAVARGTSIGRLNPAELIGHQADLNRKLKTYTKLIDSIAKRSPDSSARKTRLGRLNAQAEQLNIRLTTTQRRLRSIRDQESAHLAGKSEDASQVGLAKIGDSIIQREGGILRSAGVPLEELVSVKASLKRTLATSTNELNKLGAAGVTSGDQYDELNQKIAESNLALSRISKRTSGFGSVLQQTGALFRQFFRYALGYGALYQALAAIRALIGGVVDLDKSLKSIQAVTGATLENMSEIEVGIKKVALSTKFGTKEIAQAAKVLAQAGVKPEDFTGVLDSVATFASATESSIENAADLVSTMRNVFTELNDQTIANQLTKAINISKLTAEDLKTILSRGAQVARGFNLTSDQFLAAVTVLRNAGIKASTVATGLRQGLIELLSPDKKTISALRKRYAELGENLSNAAIRGRFFGFSQDDNPLLSVLGEFKRLGFTGAAKADFQRVFDVRASNAITALIDNMGQLQEASTKLTFGSSALKASQTQMESMANSMANLGAAVTVLADQMGSGLVDSLEDVADKATEVVQVLSDMDAKLKALGGPGVGSAVLTGLIGAAGSAALPGGKGFISRAGKGLFGFGLGATGSLVGQQAATKAGAEEGTVRAVSDVTGLLSSIGLISVYEWVKSFFTEMKGVSKGAETSRKYVKKFAGKFSILTSFISGIAKWFTKVPLLGAALTLMKAHPVGAWITGVISVLGIWKKFVSRDKLEDAKAKLVQATKNFDKAVADRDKQLEQFDEFRLGDSTHDASPGTTAASIDELETNLSDINSQIKTVFGVAGKNAAKVKAILVRINKEAAEANTKERTALLIELGSIIKLDLTKGKVDSKKISDMAELAARTVDAAKALQESVATAVTQIVEVEGDLELVQQALLHSFRKIAKENDGAYYQMIGLAEATPERIAELNRLMLLGMQEFLNGSDAAIEEQQKVTDSAEIQVDALVSAIANSDSKEKVSELMLTLRSHIIKVGDTVEDYLAKIVSKLVIHLPEEDREYATGDPQNPYDKFTNAFGRFTPKGGKPKTPQEGAQRALERTYARLQEALTKKAALQPAFDTVTRKKEELSSSEFGPVQKWYDTVTTKMGKLDTTITQMTVALEGSRQTMDYLRLDQAQTRKQQAELQRKTRADVDAARETVYTKDFEEFMSTLKPDQRVGIEALKQPNAALLIDATAIGKRKGDKVVQPDTTRGLKQVKDYLRIKFEDEMGKVFKPTEELLDAKTFLEEQLAISIRDDLADAGRTRLSLQFIEDQLLAEKTAFYKARAAIVGAPDDDVKKALNKAKELEQKQRELTVKSLASQRDDSNKLFDRERALSDEKSILEEVILIDLEKRTKEARRNKDPILGEFSADNPLVLASDIAKDQLERQLETQQAIVDRSQKDEKEHIAAKAEVRKLFIEIYKEEAELEQKILDERNKITSAQFAQDIKVLKDQLKTVERSLDFATERGYQAQVSELMEKRVQVYSALRAVELAQLKHQKATEATQKIFAASTKFNVRQLGDLFVKAQNTIKATTERFKLLEPQPSEQGDFEEAGRKKAVGVPLSERAQIEILQARISVQNGQLETIFQALDVLRGDIDKSGLKITAVTRSTFEQGSIVYPEGTTKIDQEAIDNALKSEQALVREANDLTASLAEARQEFNSMNDSISNALSTGFNIGDLASSLDDSQDSIKNLGRNIHEELVKGFEGVGDAAAGALVDSENFAEGTRQAMSDMLKQIARDMIKSGVLKMMSMMMGGGAGFAASFFAKDGGVVEKKAGGGVLGEGGVIHGPGTGTSDSVVGYVVDAKGKVTRGLRTSEGEGIVKKKSMDVLGKDFLNMMNTQPEMIARALSIASSAPIRRAAGGVIGDIKKTMDTTNVSKSDSDSVDYRFSANINIGKDEDSSVPVEVMEQMDRELTNKIGEYVQVQMKPGGLLSAVR